jgi:hypothetical protein
VPLSNPYVRNASLGYNRNTDLSIQLLLGVASRGVMRPGREADHSLLCRVEIMNE